MKRHDQRSETSISHGFTFRVVRLQSGILRIYLRLCLGERGTGFEPGNHLLHISSRMPLRRRSIFRTRCKRKIHFGIRGEEVKTGRQDPDHGFGKSVDADLPSDHVSVGMKMFSPIVIAENGDSMVLRVRLRFRESASKGRTSAKGREKLRRYAGDLLAFCRAGLTYNRSPEGVHRK